jgi:hypothetical protein
MSVCRGAETASGQRDQVKKILGTGARAVQLQVPLAPHQGDLSVLHILGVAAIGQVQHLWFG